MGILRNANSNPRRQKKKVSPSIELLGIIVCQLEAMMTDEQLEKYYRIRQDLLDRRYL